LVKVTKYTPIVKTKTLELRKPGVNPFLIKQLIYSEFQTRYKRSFIGSFWLVIEPLLSVVIWIFLFKAGIIRPGQTDISYSGYILLSTSLWAVFNSSFVYTSTTVKFYQKLFITIKTAPVNFTLAKIGLSYIYSIIPLFLITILMIFENVPFSWHWLLLPLTVLPVLFLGSAIGLINALLNIVAVDLGKLCTYLVQLIKYATPVIYTPEVGNSLLQSVISYNPLSVLIGYPRDLIIQSDHYSFSSFIWVSSISLFTLIIIMIYFKHKISPIIERIIV
jgi:ABC-type polysaccharide/polyol phosphate export permease